MLFSADIAEALAASAVEQEYVEEPVIIVDLDSEADVGNVPVDQPEEEEVVAPADPATDSELEQQSAVGNTFVTDSAVSDGEESTAIELSDSVPSKDLIFVGGSVHEYEQLVDDLQQWSTSDNSLEVVILDDEQDGIMQVSEILGARARI